MKRLGWIFGGIVVLAVLGAAAFVTVRLLSAAGQTAPDGGDSGRVMMIQSNGAGGPVSMRLKIEPSPELPDAPAAVEGLFVRREDNSFFVGTGDIKVGVEVDGATGTRQVSANHSGPVLEVVVTGDTTIYRDETDISFGDPGAQKSGDRTIQQVVHPVDSVDEIGKNTEISVWGEKRGDRIVAEVLVYRPLEG